MICAVGLGRESFVESGAREWLGRQGFERYSFRMFEDLM